MRFSRCAAAAAALMMMTAALPMQVYAETEAETSDKTEEAKALQKVILDVKGRVDIPSSLDKFEYDVNTRYGTAFYELRWYKEELKKYSWGQRTEETESITVSYFDGFINGIDHHDESRRSRIGFPALSEEDQAAQVKKLLYTIDPGIKGDPVITRDKYADVIHSSDITFNITRPIDGIPFAENSGSVTIDKDTGELVSMKLRWWNKAEFPDASKRITPEKASELYKSRKPLKESYKLFSVWEWDEEKDEDIYRQFILPVYTPKVSGENEIDAITGEYTKLYEDKKTYSYTDAYDWSNSFSYYEEEEIEEEAEYDEAVLTGAGLSEAEKSAVDEESNYMTYEQLLKKIKDDPFIVFNEELVSTGNYVSSYTTVKGDEMPSRVLSFSYSSQDDTKDDISLTVTMDAYTGEVISFNKNYNYGYNSPNENTTPASKDKVRARANAAAIHFLSDKAYEYRITGGTTEYDEDTYEGTVRYSRYVNDLPADFDTVTIEVDSRDEVLSFSYVYYDMEFPKPEPVGEDKAYEELFRNMKPDLYYTGFTDLQLRPHTYLTYKFDANYTINMNTGRRINDYNGEDYYKEEEKKEEKVIAYTDIKGHKYEHEIQTLLDYGITCTDESRLEPDSPITTGEFTRLWDSVYRTDMSYPYADKWDQKTQKYITNEERVKPLTRGEVAKIYLRTYGSEYFKAAQIPDIYKSPYKDVKENSPYIGYITFAKRLELIDPDSAAFGENKGFTKADMLKLAYDYLAGSEQKKIYDVVKI
ncbi:MAG: S-layer homology domain-containing protein [Oscillospiraceae bacterium]|nr:S-layer homology domain-containing protein [Oscillospiraceae bacterium]